MTTEEAPAANASEPQGLRVQNYCVAFIDLLGQRAALRDQGLAPGEEADPEFMKVLRASVGAILRLQKDADDIFRAAMARRENSPLRSNLSAEEREQWDEMQRTHLRMQRWSDGLVYYTGLGEPGFKCKVNAIFNMFSMAGTLAIMGLARKQPIRGAIEIAWAAEPRPNELYGAAIARAYELESEVAGYPRIVVGQQTLHFLETHIKNTSEDVFARSDRALAQLCWTFLMRDRDGHTALHYLGDDFKAAVTSANHDALYERARAFVHEQLETHQRSFNTKLAMRYSILADYFEEFRVGVEGQR